VKSGLPSSLRPNLLEIDLGDDDRLASGRSLAQDPAGHAEFVWSFRMLDEKNIPIYDLFFATNHLDGLRKMKKAMWSVHPEGGRRFSDRHAGDVSLFADSVDTAPLRKAMLARFGGQTVSMWELERWVPQLHAERALRDTREHRLPDNVPSGLYAQRALRR
jgi:hypothetical protein